MARLPYVDHVATIIVATNIVGPAFAPTKAVYKAFTHQPLASLLLPVEPTQGNDPNYFFLIDMGARGTATYPSVWTDNAVLPFHLCDAAPTGMLDPLIAPPAGAGFNVSTLDWSIALSIAPSPPEQSIIPVGSKIYIGYEGDQSLATRKFEANSDTELSGMTVQAAGALTTDVLIEFDDTKDESEIMAATKKCVDAMVKYLSTTTP